MRIDELKNCDCYIVAVPTPINDKLLPDLSCVVEATKEISLILKEEMLLYMNQLCSLELQRIFVKIL